MLTPPGAGDDPGVEATEEDDGDAAPRATRATFHWALRPGDGATGESTILAELNHAVRASLLAVLLSSRVYPAG